MSNKFNSDSPDVDAVNRLIENNQFNEAYGELLRLAEAGSAHAQLHLGWMYHFGKGVQRDVNEAKRWYHRAVRSNLPRAEFYLASTYWNERDFQQALEWLKRSASHGFAPATYHLGRMYRHGVGVQADLQKALEYVEEAARQGHLFARRDIAREMLKGRRGIARIPLGAFSLVGLTWTFCRVGLKNEDDDRLLRL